MDYYRLEKPHKLPARARPKAIDLFSGAGGITLGLCNAGYNVVFCSDHDQAYEQTHGRNFPHIPFLREEIENLDVQNIMDIALIKPGELDMLVGGPPCQGFSIIGQRETSDPRNRLFKQFLRIAIGLQPRVVVIENVSGLATMDSGAVLQEIVRSFTEAGYKADCAELLAAQYGVPQMRWRMFFIGWRNDLGKGGGFPQPTHGRRGIGELVPNQTISEADSKGFVTISEAINDLPAVKSGEQARNHVHGPFSRFQEAMRADSSGTLENHYAARLSR